MTPPGSAVPSDPGSMAVYAVAVESPVRLAFDEADAGAVVSYAARWVSAAGEAGPWSAILSRRVAAGGSIPR